MSTPLPLTFDLDGRSVSTRIHESTQEDRDVFDIALGKYRGVLWASQSLREQGCR